jgi:hypothetical protein
MLALCLSSLVHLTKEEDVASEEEEGKDMQQEEGLTQEGEDPDGEEGGGEVLLGLQEEVVTGGSRNKGYLFNNG